MWPGLSGRLWRRKEWTWSNYIVDKYKFPENEYFKKGCRSFSLWVPRFVTLQNLLRDGYVPHLYGPVQMAYATGRYSTPSVTNATAGGQWFWLWTSRARVCACAIVLRRVGSHVTLGTLGTLGLFILVIKLIIWCHGKAESRHLPGILQRAGAFAPISASLRLLLNKS